MKNHLRHIFLICVYAAIVIVVRRTSVIYAQTAAKGENVPEIESLKSDVKRLKDSVKGWNLANLIFIGIAAICAGGLLVTTFGLNRKNDELSDARERMSELEQQETAHAQAEAAQAQLALRKYVEQVASRQGPRSLNVKPFLDALWHSAKGRVLIQYKENDSEAHMLALQICRWLGEGSNGDGAGWNVPEPTPFPSDIGLAGSGSMSGVTILTKNVSEGLKVGSKLFALSQALGNGLTNGGVTSFATEERPDLPNGTFMILIGQKK